EVGCVQSGSDMLDELLEAAGTRQDMDRGFGAILAIDGEKVNSAIRIEVAHLEYPVFVRGVEASGHLRDKLLEAAGAGQDMDRGLGAVLAIKSHEVRVAISIVITQVEGPVFVRGVEASGHLLDEPLEAAGAG